MKKKIAGMLALMLACSMVFSGCSSTATTTATTATTETATATESTTEAAEAPAAEEAATEEVVMATTETDPQMVLDDLAAKAEGQSLDGITVGFSQMENNMPFRIAETNSMLDEAEVRGVNMIYTDAQSSTSKQISDVEDLIAQGVDYLVVVPREYEGMEDALAEAEEKGIKVIQSSTGARGYMETFVGADFVAEGRTAAEWLGERMEGEGNIIQLTGIPGGNVAQERQEGFEEVLAADYPNMNIIASQTANFTRSEGQSVMANLIQTYGDDIDAVYAHNDEMALGAIQALKAAGMTPGEDIIIISVDGTKDGVNAIVAGEMNCSIECKADKGPPVFDAIAALERGETLPEFLQIPGIIYDDTNIENYIGAGY